ncbi:basic phospholipase A2 PA-12A isoform X1 [Euwallacea fornicatus]|uniref:basic phospholipase A2 PA-12A isoform X1 n=1 Tax=Euwallacea fornicatus TaxID=995702 RepID=UPI00338F8D79
MIILRLMVAFYALMFNEIVTSYPPKNASAGKMEMHLHTRNHNRRFNVSVEESSYMLGYPIRTPKKLIKYDSYLNDSFEIKRWKIRKKRGVVELYNMISCATDCDPLSFKGYGCFCGFLGSGNPVDGIDKCCKMHDVCYELANCPMYLEYFVPYHWRCWNKRPFCGANQRELIESSGPCAYMLCECDRVFSECVRRFPCPSEPAFCSTSKFRLFQNAFMLFT